MSYECNAIIKSASILINDHGVLDCLLGLEFGGSSQGFGGYALYLPKSFTHHKLESVAGHHIYRILTIADVQDFSKLPGRAIRVRKKSERDVIDAIGHIIKNDWFSPKEDYAELSK